jgi:hypothetical protein
MGALRRATLLTGAALLVNVAAAGAVQSREGQKETQPPGSAPSAAATPATSSARESFAGVWVYNPEESLNAANGRKEDNAAMRRAGNSGQNGSANGGGAGRNGSGGGGGNSGGGAPGQANPSAGAFGGSSAGYGSPFTSLIANERRDLVRDLLEVPVELSIKLTENDITFTDHLKRELTYPTTGKKKKYQLSASVFEAKTYWDGPVLKKEIEGTENFKMSETYMLSESGKRLFVIVRVANSQDKDAPPVGVNRVYDRIEK